MIRLPDGRRLAYAEYGDPGGAPVFFFQGTPSSRLMHPDEAVTRDLGARLIVADRPGFGLSDPKPFRTLLDWPDDIVALADALGIGRFGLVGISGGGPYAAACAYRIPQRLTAVTIVGGSGPVDLRNTLAGAARERHIGYVLAQRAPWLLRLVILLARNPRRNPARFQAQFSQGAAAADRAIMARPAMREMFVRSYAEASRQGVTAFADEVILASKPWGFPLQDITTPVHLWHGEEDRNTPLAMARAMAAAIPNCCTTFLPGEGHLFLFERWGEILGDLLTISEVRGRAMIEEKLEPIHPGEVL